MTASGSPVAGAGSVPVAAGRGGVTLVLRWELRKLAAQLRVRAVAAVCLVAPFLFVAVLDAQGSVPADTLFGRWVHESGYAVSLVLLGFAGQWLLPFLASVTAGDIFAAEDHYGTWSMLLTRSRSRFEVFVGKVLAAGIVTVLGVVLLAASSMAAGVLLVGSTPLVGLSGQLVPPGSAAAMTAASWAFVVLPTLEFAAVAVLLSVLSRNTWVGIVGPVAIGLLVQLLSLLSTVDPVRPALPTTGFEGWHGLFASPGFRGPMEQGATSAAVAVTLCLTCAYLVFARRDIGAG